MAEVTPEHPRRDPRRTQSAPERKPPAHLSREAKKMWSSITEGWVLAADSLPLLRAALESWDLFQTCRAQVQKEGPTVRTGDGMIRQHPAVRTGNEALTQFRLCLKQLGLEPPKEA